MNKLLRSNFLRLWKSKLFWLETVFMFGFGVFITVGQYSDMVKYDELHYFDSNLLFYVAFIGCFAAVFCSIFTGTDYSDGTIRNKLVVGHHRSSIYLSNWLTSIVAAMIMAIAFLISYCSLGYFLLEASVATTGKIVTLVVISIFTIVAFVSLFHMLSMLITKKSAASVVCLLFFFGLLMLAIIIQGRLEEPEYISGYVVTVNGLEQTKPELNPRYLQPAARKIYQFFLDFPPTGQSVVLTTYRVVHPYLMMVYSAIISVATTVFGIFAFRKKDLK